MRLKERIKRLKQATAMKTDSLNVRIFSCYKNEGKDIFTIDDLGFKGTIAEGEAFMREIERKSDFEPIFVITLIPRPHI